MKNYFLLPLLLLCFITKAQQPKKLNSSEIHDSLKKLNFLGTVLYVAAHPDDENTRLISYLSNHINARTAYLSLTRGDGGQNLIGPELRELLGVLRTQELLAARRIDGGEQFFSRANDFGYSKHPEETFSIWDRDLVLEDVVRVYRSFRPDIIINRFDHRTPGKTHGHHTASAILGLEAFNQSNDKSKFTDQLATYKTWQPKRIFMNTSWWFYGSREKFEKADKSKFIEVNAGVYYPSKGLSNTEIAALSRSQHKCQGFGSTGTRGDQIEYLELLEGKMPKNNDIFDGINTTWSRVKGGNKIGAILNPIQKSFNFNNPSAHIPDLLKAYTLIQELEDEYWKTQKTKEIIAIIEACSGLFLEAVASNSSNTIGDKQDLEIEAINRSNIPMTLKTLRIMKTPINKDTILKNNQKFNFKSSIHLSQPFSYDTPYWLNSKASLGMYYVEDKNLIGLPETPKQTTVKFDIEINKTLISITKPIVYKYTNPAKGEIYEPFNVLPDVSVKIENKVYIYNNSDSKKVNIDVTASKDNIAGTLTLDLPKGWTASPKVFEVNLKTKGMSTQKTFVITPPSSSCEGELNANFKLSNNTVKNTIIDIDYDHIPRQKVLMPAKAKLVKLDIKKKGELIGYIKGSGDVTVESLKHIGYTVNQIDLPSLNSVKQLKQYDAIVVGIRAFNVLEDIAYKNQILFDYVKDGGNVVVQYNTRHRLKTKDIAPYPITLSRDRVTDEHATISFLAPNHPVLNFPNKITSVDFKGWVQERGLYFPSEWDKAFTPILSMHDKGETPKNGSLLVAQYGKGYYIYTGISFFREFPAGVSGAYRLFANLISIGKDDQ